MKYEIMLGILFELLSKKCVKAKYLAEKFEVSVRSIHRYINCLEMAGVPLYTIRGNQGGFAIVDTYKFSSSFMTVKEFEQTINALNAINSSVPNKVLDSAINKLKSAVKNESSGLNIKSGNLIIDAGPWGDAVGYKSKLAVLQKSIEENKKLFIRYHDRNGDVTERLIEPHVIVFKQGLWYVYAYCDLRNEFRFFKTGRIEQATVTNETFIRQDLSKMDLPLDFWQENLDCIDVVMEIDKSIVSDVEEWLGIENVKLSNGKFIASVKLPHDKGLINKIMGYGGGIKVLEPQSLREEIKKCTEEIINNYK
ncbi:MAG: YafY family transcriptional regulator [Clostridiales bacterium]|nr:YafY family transcriptional regulator [Clostridiales bacterium]